MKMSFRKLGFVFAFMLFASSLAVAGGFNQKFLEKAKTAIENASPDDWFTRAQWAKRCMARDINTEEVANWIDSSLEIQENAYTLEVKGDYYAKNKMKEKAMSYYIKSIQSSKIGDESYDREKVQQKIFALR